jgi:hypothetical protein
LVTVTSQPGVAGSYRQFPNRERFQTGAMLGFFFTSFARLFAFSLLPSIPTTFEPVFACNERLLGVLRSSLAIKLPFWFFLTASGDSAS